MLHIRPGGARCEAMILVAELGRVGGSFPGYGADFEVMCSDDAIRDRRKITEGGRCLRGLWKGS